MKQCSLNVIPRATVGARATRAKGNTAVNEMSSLSREGEEAGGIDLKQKGNTGEKGPDS